MILKYDSEYVCGLLRGVSVNLNPSFIDAFCLSKNNYETQFKKIYNYKKDIVIHDEQINLIDFLTNTLQVEDKYISSLIYWLERCCGKFINITSAEGDIIEDLSGWNGGTTGFYFLEELYFIHFDKMVVCLLIGNNE